MPSSAPVVTAARRLASCSARTCSSREMRRVILVWIGASSSGRNSWRPAHRYSVVAASVEGLIYRGPLLAYAKDRDGHRYAVLDTGRVLSAFRTDAPAHAPGLEIRATSAAGRDARGRQVLGWRLEVERQRQRERGRER